MYATKNNDMAVSPIVATLVLIVVAVIGAVAVGTIMGTFSTDVSKQANTGQVSGAASNEILIAGSTTVQPAAENIAKTYMAAHPGMKITVQGGGSGAGFSSTKMGIVDIGAMSESPVLNPTKYDATGMNLNEYRIGASGIVIAVNSADTTATGVTKGDLKAIYNTTAQTIPGSFGTATEVVYRADASGTADTFMKNYLGYSGQFVPVAPTSGSVSGQQGNAGVLGEIQKTPTAVGFLDMGYAFNADGTTVTGIRVLDLDGVAASKNNIKTAAKSLINTGSIPAGQYPLARGLYLITNGQPNSVVKSFITFAQSPGAQADINNAGMFANADL